MRKQNSIPPANRGGISRAVAIASNDWTRGVLLIVTLVLLVLFARRLSAQETTAQAKGLAIATEMDRRDIGFADFKAEMVMVLRNRHGEESTRNIRSRTLEVDGDGDKVLIVFETPKDVNGTAFLSFSHKTGPDDQWLYLPALKRVKRIASNNKSGPFMGSEFAYEDISSEEVEKYTYKYLRDEEYKGAACFVIERYPVDDRSGYTKQVAWIDQAEYRLQKIDFYDRKEALMKTLEYRDYAKHIDKYWRANEMHMVNHQTGKSTTLTWSEFTFRNGYTPRDFDKNSLARAR